MKGLLLTPLAFAAFTLALQAQSDVPSVESVTEPVSDRAQNPDMDELPPVDEGTPDMDLPGMRTVEDGDLDGDGTISDDTAPLDEGFVKDVEGADPDTYEADSDTDAGMAAPAESDGYTPVVDEAEQGLENVVDEVGETIDNVTDGEVDGDDADQEEGRWIDRDDDGYTPVVDEVEQGTETAVKATGEALSTAKDAVEDVFTDDDADADLNVNTDSDSEMDTDDSRYIDSDSDGYTPVVDEVEQGAETAVKSTGEAVGQATDEAEELNEVEEFIEGGDDGDADDSEGYQDPN